MKRPLCWGGVLMLAAIWIAAGIRGPAPYAAVEDGSRVTVVGTAVSRKNKSDQYIIEIQKPELKTNLKGTKSQECKKIKGILVYLDKSERNAIKIGQRAEICGKARLFEEASNPGQFDMRRYRYIHGIDFSLMDAKVVSAGKKYDVLREELQGLRERMAHIYEEIYDEEDEGIAKAMVLGDREGLPDSVRSLYQAVGISHILSISGLHIGVIGVGIYRGLMKLRLKRTAAGAMSMVLITLYAQLTGGAASVVRASVMLSVCIAAEMIGRKSDILSSMSLSLMVILISEPLLVYDSGFLLSFGAVSGIGIISPILKHLIPRADDKRLSGVVASLSVSIFTLPMILYFFYQFPLFSILINLLIVPLMGILLMLLMASGLLGLLMLRAGVVFAMPSITIFHIIKKLAELDASLPFNQLVTGKPAIWKIILYYLMLGCVVVLFKYRDKVKKVRLKSLLILMAMLGLMFAKERRKLEIMSIDVGQGDSALVASADTTFLIDCGSTDIKNVAKYRVIPCLKAVGIGEVDYAVMTHSDADHVNGFLEIFSMPEYQGIKIKNLIMPQIKARDEAYEEVRKAAEKHGVKVIFMKRGDAIKSGKLMVKCIHPAADYEPEDANSYSTVLDVRYGDFSALFTGDVQGSGEEAVTNSCAERYTLLKAAHHGSKNSDKEAFLKKAMPKITFISCGKNNSYGHPHRETLERLKDVGTKIYVTKDSGALALFTDGKKIRIKTYK